MYLHLLTIHQSKFYVWKQKPAERMTVWTFWQRLQEAGLAFWPGRSTHGAPTVSCLPWLWKLPGLFPQLVRCLIRDPRFLLYCCIGVFPMIFLPGLSGQFVAVADTEDAAQALRPRAEACLQVAGIALGRQPQQPCSHPGCWFRRRSPQPLFTLTHSLLPPHINLVCACFRYCPVQGSRQSAQSCPCSGAWILCAVCALGACGA